MCIRDSNYSARIFVGPADGVDGNLDGNVWGDPTYANDQLVMKWNKAWDECNEHGSNDPAYCAGAWETNEWNGKVPDGSGEVWHYKIIWVGSEGSSYWRDGGELIWNHYEVIMSQGISEGGNHEFPVHATPNGFGAGK